MRNAARAIVLAVVGVAVGASLVARATAPPAGAVSPSQVEGAYQLKLKGDGFWRSSSEPYRVGRVAGNASLLISPHDPDDGGVHAEILLDAALAGSIADLATPDPLAFVGDGYVVGDCLTLVDSRSNLKPDFVNAFTIVFMKGGGKLAGHWLASFPAASADAGPASAVGLDFTGRRVGHAKDRRPRGN